MSAILDRTVLPPAAGSTLPDVSRALESVSPTTLLSADGKTVVLPDELVAVLRDAAQAMEQGRAVTLATQHTVLTTQEAAAFLGVSRPTVVRLLRDGVIPFTQPSSHRRVRLADLIEHRDRTRHARRETLTALTREATAEGLPAEGFETTR